jgi:signal transduction histidine kinase
MGFVFVYTFDPDTAMWALVYILPLEGAIRFGLRGALATMGAATAAYTVREIYGATAFGNDFLPTSISFRMGIGFIIAWVAGAMASSLERDRAALELANAELRSANEVKDDFLAMTNHELRTPLTTILGYTALLLQRWDVLDDERRIESVRWIDHQGRRLRALVEDLLTLSSAQAGALDLLVEPVEVAEVVAEAIASNGVAAAEVSNQCPPGLRVQADFARLTQVMANYVSNALKYGRPPVEVVARRRGEDVEICVCDRGSGVDERFVPRLFDKFSQASSGASRTAEGTGLGLAIARRLTQAQGGTAFYEPNEPTGSMFCVRLPGA